MDIFTQKKMLVRLCILLVILNLSLVVSFYYFTQNKDYKHDEEHLAAVLKRELNLNDAQAEKIKTLREDFFAKEKALAQTIRSKRDSMNIAMFNKTTDENQVREIARRVADGEYQMELLRIEQAQQLKTICTPEQLEKMEDLVKEIKNYFKPKKK